MGRDESQSMNPQRVRRCDRRLRGNTLLAKWSLACVIPALLLSALQLSSAGRVSAPVLALDTIASALVPFGLLSLALAFERPREDHPGEGGGDGGGGRPPDDGEPSSPSGGTDVDWERFEADFQAYAEARRLVSA